MLYNKITILLTLIYFLVRFDISGSQKVCFNNKLITVTKRGLNNTQFWSAKVQDFEQCAKLCIRRKLCQSINYDSQTQSCELNSGLRTPETTKKGDNLVYSEFSWWPAKVVRSFLLLVSELSAKYKISPFNKCHKYKLLYMVVTHYQN